MNSWDRVKDYYSPIIGRYSVFHGLYKWGSAHPDGTLRVYPEAAKTTEFHEYHCRSHRQAVRQLRRWMRGQGVTARRIK